MEGIDLERFTLLWTKAQPVVASYIASLVRDFNDAEDVLHNVALALLRKRADYDPERPFENWAIGIAKRQVLLYFRQCRRDPHVFGEQFLDRFTESFRSLAGSATNLSLALDTCLKKVKGRGRKALLLRYADGLKSAAIGQNLGVSEGAVRKLLHRLRTGIRECVQRELRRLERTP